MPRMFSFGGEPANIDGIVKKLVEMETRLERLEEEHR